MDLHWRTSLMSKLGAYVLELGNEMNNVISFFSPEHKCGVSMIAQCTAEMIAKENKDMDVLLVHGDEFCGDLYSPKVCESMDNIRPYLSEELFDVEHIYETSKYDGNLHIIGGPKGVLSKGVLHPDMAEYFLKKMSKRFSVVICDAGSNIEYGMSLGTLYASDMRFLVLTQEESALRKYEWQSSLYRMLDLETHTFIINKFSRGAVLSDKILIERLGIDSEKVVRVPFSSYGASAENEGRSLLSFKERKFEKAVKEISNIITAKLTLISTST